MESIKDILNSKSPSTYIRTLYDKGRLSSVCPEVYDLKDTTKGHKDNFEHTLGVIDNVCDINAGYKMKLVAMLHDIGKPSVKSFNKDKGWTFHGHERVGADMAMKIMDREKESDVVKDYVYRMIKFHGRVKMHTDVTDAAIRRLCKEVGDDIIFDLIEFCKCDLTTRFDDKKQRIRDNLDAIKKRIIEVRKKDADAKWRSPISGYDIMELTGLQQGPELGRIKKEIDPRLKAGTMTRQEAITYIKNKYVG